MPVRLVCGRFPDRSGNVELGALALRDFVALEDLAPEIMESVSTAVAVAGAVGRLETDKADKATTLAGYGITDAYTKVETGGKISTAVSAEAQARDAAIANAISAVKNSAPEAFDTLKEIADWIGDDRSGAQALINKVSNKVDKVPGKGLSTHDYDADAKAKVDALGTVSTKDVPASGDAAADQVVMGGDSRLSDARTPTAHKSSHAAGGADALSPADIGAAPASHTHSQSDVTGLADALAGKLSKAEAEAGFGKWELSGLPSGATNVYGPEFRPDDSAYILQFSYNEYYYEGWAGASSDDVTSLEFDCTDYGDQPHITVTATRTRLPTMADIPAKTSDLTNDSGYITQHQQLTPIYGGNGQQYGDWVYSGVPQGATDIELPTMEPDGRWVAQFLYGGDTYFGAVYADENATRLDFEFESSTPHTPKFNVTATLALNPVIGYTLGSQSGKPLQPQGDYAPATNIPKAALASGVQTSLALADTAVQPSALRYDLITITTGQLQDRAVQKVILNVASTTLVLPTLTDLTGKVSDFGIDMMNAYEDSGTAAAASFQLDGTLGTDYNLIVPKGETWSDMTALAPNEMAAFYFTRSAFQTGDVPTWEVVKKVVEFVPVPAAP